jgi:hypothetical protein
MNSLAAGHKAVLRVAGELKGLQKLDKCTEIHLMLCGRKKSFGPLDAGDFGSRTAEEPLSR